MPTITLNFKSQKATDNQIISAQELKDQFLYGIKIQKDGRELPDSTYNDWIQFAKKDIERSLSIKLDLQIFTENKDFHLDDWRSWSQVKATFPIVCPIALDGYLGQTKQVAFPKEWLSVRKTSDNETYSRLIHVVPNQSVTYQQSAALYLGVFPNMGWMGAGTNTPEYWTIEYITGFLTVPIDIKTAIGMLAALNILTVANETIASALGILGGNSKSISIDGLSQSTSMYINGQTGIFGARIKQYTETLNGVGSQDGLIQKLKDYYGSIVWTTL